MVSEQAYSVFLDPQEDGGLVGRRLYHRPAFRARRARRSCINGWEEGVAGPYGDGWMDGWLWCRGAIE